MHIWQKYEYWLIHQKVYKYVVQLLKLDLDSLLNILLVVLHVVQAPLPGYGHGPAAFATGVDYWH